MPKFAKALFPLLTNIFLVSNSVWELALKHASRSDKSLRQRIPELCNCLRLYQHSFHIPQYSISSAISICVFSYISYTQPVNETRTIFFLGKPGCGKGTQATMLAEATNWPMFSAGKLFRELEQERTPVARKLKRENEAGFLSPHWFAMYLYLKCLFSIPDDTSAIFDGFNRKIQEAELIISSLQWLGRSFSIVHIAISDEEAHRRIEGRKHVEGRMDDHAVEERLKEYREYTKPAIELFHNAGVLIEIDGEREREAIAADIRSALNLPAKAGLA